MTSEGAHLGLHLPPSAASSRNPTTAVSPPSPPSTQQPAVTEPPSAMSAAPSHSNPAQNRTSTQSRQVPTVARSMSANKDDVIRCQRDEIARLQAQLAQLATSQASIPQANQHGATPSQAGISSTSGSPNAPVQQANPQQALFLNEAAAEQVQAQLIAKATEDSPLKKAALPDIVPGFKASPLSLAIPTKVEDAFKSFKYVPYSALTHAACARAAEGEEDFVINSQGGLSAKPLDRKDEKSILIVDWLSAAATTED